VINPKLDRVRDVRFVAGEESEKRPGSRDWPGFSSYRRRSHTGIVCGDDSRCRGQTLAIARASSSRTDPLVGRGRERSAIPWQTPTASPPYSHSGQSHFNSDRDYQHENADQSDRAKNARVGEPAFPIHQPGFRNLDAIALYSHSTMRINSCTEDAVRL